jgi:hypothetical protein
MRTKIYIRKKNFEKFMHMVHAGGRPLLDINAISTPF